MKAAHLAFSSTLFLAAAGGEWQASPALAAESVKRIGADLSPDAARPTTSSPEVDPPFPARPPRATLVWEGPLGGSDPWPTAGMGSVTFLLLFRKETDGVLTTRYCLQFPEIQVPVVAPTSVKRRSAGGR
ncbi:MAG: hypothetical protein JXQ73_09995 [Phycisphaerae bacterium]|nr:hypothetical protein [Phycisphaerae bacterium]